MQYRTIFAKAVILTFLVCSLAGCPSYNPKDIQAFAKPQELMVTAENYILRPPDEIEIHSVKVAEINLQRQLIRPDGKVSFEGLGEVEVAGKTIGEAANLLREKAMLLYTLAGDNPIDVRVVAFASHRFYVLGQVDFPGPKPYTGRDTVFNALAAANPTVMAWRERIQVIRPSQDKSIKAKIFEVKFDEMSARGELSKDVLLQENDILYVPPTVLASIGLKVEELMRPVGRIFQTTYYIDRPD